MRRGRLKHRDARNRSATAAESDKLSVLCQLELQMSYRAVWQSNRNNIIRSATLKYLDARIRSATTAGSETLFELC
eukprot:7345971-Pyramimonas_sp.AAC.1